MGVPEIRTGKRAKIAGNLLHVSSYWASNNIPSVEAQLVEKRAKRFLSVWSYFADVMLRTKDTRFSARYIFAFQESLGTRLTETFSQFRTSIIQSENSH